MAWHFVKCGLQTCRYCGWSHAPSSSRNYERCCKLLYYYAHNVKFWLGNVLRNVLFFFFNSLLFRFEYIIDIFAVIVSEIFQRQFKKVSFCVFLFTFELHWSLVLRQFLQVFLYGTCLVVLFIYLFFIPTSYCIIPMCYLYFSFFFMKFDKEWIMILFSIFFLRGGGVELLKQILDPTASQRNSTG